MNVTARQRVGWGAANVIVVLIAAIPILWLISLSFKDPSTITDGSFYPHDWTTANYRGIFDQPLFTHALVNSIGIALIATFLGVALGAMAAYAIARLNFPGKRLLNSLLDIPLSVSPIVVGLALVLVYGGRNGWLGPTLAGWGLDVIFSTPGIIMATTFVALPLMIRELVPVLEEIGIEQEQAAQSLGANGLQRFWRITLPSIKWGITYGVVLTLARSLGEFGAVKVVSGNVLGQTRTATLAVEEKYLNFDQQGAYATAFLLAMVSVACIVVVGILRPKNNH